MVIRGFSNLLYRINFLGKVIKIVDSAMSRP